MASWILVPCLGQLRTDLNRIAPNRDKSSDGTIGDTAHQTRLSDHNDDEIGKVPIKDADAKHEVHAYDADVDLREPGLTMEKVVQHILSRCRSGKENRLRYIIYNKRIWRDSNDWRQEGYSGDNPHDKHAHFSASYDTVREADTSSWHLEEIPVALTDADKKWIADQMATAAASAAEVKALLSQFTDDFLDVKIGDEANPNRSVRDVLKDLAKLRGYLVGDPKDTANAAIPADAPIARIVEGADLTIESAADNS
jgi:hypothetical protein